MNLFDAVVALPLQQQCCYRLLTGRVCRTRVGHTSVSATSAIYSTQGGRGRCKKLSNVNLSVSDNLFDAVVALPLDYRGDLLGRGS